MRRYRDRYFEVARCANCGSLHCEKVDDLQSYYADYPIRNQRLDYFTRSWYQVVLRRLERAGLSRDDEILDYGCNRGLFIDFLRENGYGRCTGYDPYVEAFSSQEALEQSYDWIVSLDVIEHADDPRTFLARMAGLLRPGGRLCIETPNADGIVLGDSETFVHAIHVPYHLHILSERALLDLSKEQGLDHVATYLRWYMDSWQPGTARRLFESLMMYAGNDLDVGYEPPRLGLFLRHPSLLFHLFFGYFLPSTRRDHMMMVMRAPAGRPSR
ncbi:MAG: class I SAM-dependent methyltransferase [Burkholderiales bacterium]|nr:class I SAM-dependent methyltransferase [Burkholderiales bacterium]